MACRITVAKNTRKFYGQAIALFSYLASKIDAFLCEVVIPSYITTKLDSTAIYVFSA